LSIENGVLLCHHANNVNNAARQHVLFTLENCKYRLDARAQTFNARDNVSQFIRWARCIAGVREVLMFESDDLILRKNEKNFLLCLLEIARYGAKFGVSVPALIKLEDEIEREIQHDKQTGIAVRFDHEQFDTDSRLYEQAPIDLANHVTYTNNADKLSVHRLHTIEQTHVEQQTTVDRSQMSDDVINTVTICDGTRVDSPETPSRPMNVKDSPMEAPPLSSQLHKTVDAIVA
jgi:hypothetical protein